MNEIYPNIYKKMNGGGLFNLFGTSSSDNSLLRNEMEQTLSHEVEQLKEYLVVPGNLNGFFKKIYLPKPISNPISSEEEGQKKLYNFINEDINNKLTSNDTNIPQVVEIPRKIYKKGKSSDVVIEIESVKINKQDLLNHLANFKTDLDELLERVIKNLDKLKEKMLRHRLINLDNIYPISYVSFYSILLSLINLIYTTYSKLISQ
jgi:thiamine kinase-like enzyme